MSEVTHVATSAHDCRYMLFLRAVNSGLQMNDREYMYKFLLRKEYCQWGRSPHAAGLCTQPQSGTKSVVVVTAVGIASGVEGVLVRVMCCMR